MRFPNNNIAKKLQSSQTIVISSDRWEKPLHAVEKPTGKPKINESTVFLNNGTFRCRQRLLLLFVLKLPPA